MLKRLLHFVPLCVSLGFFGCGDGVECPTGFVAFVTSLHDGAAVTSTGDVDPTTPGLQLDVTAQTTLSPGSLLTLSVAGETYMAMVGEAGDVTFAGVTIPDGTVELSLEGADDKGCGTVSESITISANSVNALCDVALEEATVMRPAYTAPVLNASTDSDPNTAGFQAHFVVTSAADAAIELVELDAGTGAINVLGTGTADSTGDAQIAVSLDQGARAVWARCAIADLPLETSAITAYVVDTIAPEVCEFSFPLPAQFLTPDDDEDNDISNGIQVTLIGDASAQDNDIEGQPTTFSVGDLDIAGSALALGQSTAAAAFGSPGEFSLDFSLEDRAGNSCSTHSDVTVDLAGCSIVLVAPVAPVTFDSNPELPGFQTNVVVAIDPACAGQPVTTTCGNDASGVAAASGDTSLEVTLGTDFDEGVESCRTEVTATSGFVTFVDTTFVYDNQAPFVQLRVVNPANTPCGSQITESADIDANAAGVQIAMTITSPLAVSRELAVNGGAPITGIGPGDTIPVTLSAGDNSLVATARDEQDNAATASCPIRLVDILVGFSPPIDDGRVGLADDDNGDVTAGITLDLTGTVSVATAAVTVTIDGGAPQSAVVVGNTWTLAAQTLVAGPHTIDVNATDGPRLGNATLALEVDLTPPDAPPALTVLPLTRQSVQLSFTGSVDTVSYLGWWATVPLDDSNVDTVGVPIAMPAPSGGGETVDVDQLRPYQDLFFAVAAVDASGNRSALATDGASQLSFDESAPFSPPNPLDDGLGYRFAHGDFNGDGFQDVAVGAPFATVSGVQFAGRVHIYFGGLDGLAAVPDVTIAGPPEFGYFGTGLAALRWDNDAFDDLAIGAPFSDGVNGQVFVFAGGAAFAPTSFADAAVRIGNNPANGNADAFVTGGLGWSLASGRFDGDELDDLAMSAVNADGGVGGVAILYGGTTATEILLSETLTAGLGDAALHYFANPDSTLNFWSFGNDLFNVGRTEGVADQRDDLAVGYFSDAASVVSQEKIYLVRGRSVRPVAGLSSLTLNAFDVTYVLGGITRGQALGEHIVSIDDQDGDGRRDLVLSASALANWTGRVYLVSGGLTGTANFATPGVVLTSFINLAANEAFGSFLATGNGNALADIDNDGLEDLVIGAGRSPNVRMDVWYGGSIPTGNAAAADADIVLPAPAGFINDSQEGQPAGLNGIWVDINDDGLDDLCVGDHRADSLNGSFVALWDEPLP